MAVGELDVLDDEIDGGWLCRDIELGDAPGYHAATAIRFESGIEGDFPLELSVRRFAWT